MKIVLVGNRDGKAVINWPGVLGSAAIVATLTTAGAATFMIAFSWFSLVALVMSAAIGVGSVIGIGIQRAFQLPIEQLKPLQ